MEILVTLTIISVPVIYILWDRYFRIYPLSYFGIENVQRVAKWESPEWREQVFSREGANKQVISSQADSLIKISRIWADFFPANTSNQPI